MTLVLAWRSFEGHIWIVSDSRISGETELGRSVQTDRGAKILKIPVSLWENSASEELGSRILMGSVGLVYAGSSLIALQAYAAVSHLWSHLLCVDAQEPPRLEDLANHLAFFLDAYGREVSAVRNEPQACQCLLVGSLNGSPECYQISIGEIQGEYKAIVCAVLLGLRGDVFGFGSGAKLALPKAKRAHLEALGENSDRGILKFLREYLPSSGQIDIGGSVQIGIARNGGFDILGDLVSEDESIKIRFRGFDLDEILRVGDWYAAFPAMA